MMTAVAEGLIPVGTRVEFAKTIGESDIYLFAGIDLSSQSKGVGLFYKAHFYDYREDIQNKFSDIARVTRENSEKVATVFGLDAAWVQRPLGELARIPVALLRRIASQVEGLPLRRVDDAHAIAAQRPQFRPAEVHPPGKRFAVGRTGGRWIVAPPPLRERCAVRTLRFSDPGLGPLRR